ncbi:hypothetical protein [Streptomyces flavofungini]|uniref:hypothetical protein n=1 Tax=Streptomyces flavofungini TaxID=68200 RepID=UPI0034E05595
MRNGYSREKFRHWIDADHDGCSTRTVVLLDEAVTDPERTGRCTLADGTWFSPHDDRQVDGPHGLPMSRYTSGTITTPAPCGGGFCPGSTGTSASGSVSAADSSASTLMTVSRVISHRDGSS